MSVIAASQTRDQFNVVSNSQSKISQKSIDSLTGDSQQSINTLTGITRMKNIKGYKLRKDSLRDKMNNLSENIVPKFSKPLLIVKDGQLDISSFYRSHLDTPYVQKDLYQHQANGAMRILLGNQLPFRLTFLLRRTNSNFFKNLNDIQVIFDVATFQQMLRENLKKNIQLTHTLADSLEKMQEMLGLNKYDLLSKQFENEFSQEKWIEAHELLNNKELSWDITLPDSLAIKKSDSLEDAARGFLKRYETAKAQLDSAKSLYDSLQNQYTRIKQTLDSYNNSLNRGVKSYFDVRKSEKERELENEIPRMYQWLLNIRKLSIGKSFLNHSELSAKNVALKGFNFEYNSWYYVALSAGLLDYRLRNVFTSVNNRFNGSQYLVMTRLGVGDISNTHLIFSFFKGRKQNIPPGSSTNANKYYNVTGLAAEVKYSFNRAGYIKMEAAETISPDFKKHPITKSKWTLSDKTNKAYYLQIKYSIFNLNAFIDGYYKYTGPNFQSFSAYQSNSSATSFSIKWDQYFLHKQIKLSAGVKKNEYSNVYFIQDQRSNTVFKTFTATFKKRKWPVVSVSFMPLSQYTVFNGIILETKFNSLNINSYHYYKIGDIRASSALMYSQFFNDAVDTSYAYYNSKNFLLNQSFNFKRFDAGFSITHSASSNYQFNCIDQNIQLPIRNIGVITGGVKVNTLNEGDARIGYYVSYRLPLKSRYSFYFFFSNDYMPVSHGILINNKIGNVQLTKTF